MFEVCGTDCTWCPVLPVHSRLWPRINYFRIKSPKCAWHVVLPAWQVVFLPYSSVESVGGSWSCPEAPFSHTPLFALVKLDLSIFCKEEALALHTSVFWPYFLRYQVLILRSVTTFSSSIDRWCRSQCSLDLTEVRLLSVLLLTTNSKIYHTCILMHLRRGQYKKSHFLLQKWLTESALLHLV